MKKLALATGVIALVAILIASFAYLAGSVSIESSKGAILAATIVWFISAPILGRQTEIAQASE